MFKLSDHAKYRILEIIPGALVWTTFIVAIALSFVRPLWVIYFIIIFSLYWLVRILYMSIWLITSWKRYRHDIKVDWMAKVKETEGWERIYHLVVLPMVQEPLEVVRLSFEELCKVKYPLDKFIVVLSGEERARENFLRVAPEIEKEFGDRFFKLIITAHPDGVVGEIRGKGANSHWAGRRAKEFIDEKGIPYDDVIVSCFDVDTITHPQYFSCLAYKYLTHPTPTRTSYQPLALYNNNIWESPAITRIVSDSTTFWLLTDLARKERLFTFSSHSMSFRALVDVGFWQNDIVTEDSRIFLQCFMRYDGDYTVTPMYIPVSMNTVYMGKTWRTMVNQYRQVRRWAYGVENFPYMAWHFWKNRKIPRFRGFRYLWNQLEGIYSWATAPVLILVLGHLPLWTASTEVKATAVAQNAPFVLEKLMTFAMVGLISSVILGIMLLPPKPSGHPREKFVFMVLQWALFPVSMVVFGSVPATDAMTRLMFGRYLGFWVTEKTGVKHRTNPT